MLTIRRQPRDENSAALAALNIDRNAPRATARSRSRERAAGPFLSYLLRCRDGDQRLLDEAAGASATSS